MPKTQNLFDCKRLAAAISACGGTVPKPLAALLSAHDVLTAPALTTGPKNAVLDAALDGSLTPEKLAKLLPAAATAAMIDQYRQELSRDSERTLVSAFHRALEDGGATEIILSLRPNFDSHAQAIAKARSLFTSESDPSFILASGEPGTIEAWQGLENHVRAVAKIVAVVSLFGSRPTATFPQIREFALGETFKLDDRALMCTTGGLVADSAEFNRPGDWHKGSAFFRVAGLRLHTVLEAQARHDEWAALEFDKIHGGLPGGRIDSDGTVIYDEPPVNPYRAQPLSVR